MSREAIEAVWDGTRIAVSVVEGAQASATCRQRIGSLGWDGMEWDRVGWDGVESYGVGWDGMEPDRIRSDPMGIGIGIMIRIGIGIRM